MNGARGIVAFLIVVVTLLTCAGPEVACAPTAVSGRTHSLLSVRASTRNVVIATYNIEGYYHQSFPGDTANGLGAPHLGAIVNNVATLGATVVGLQEYRDAVSGQPRQIQAALPGSWAGAYGRGRWAQLPILYDASVVSLVASKYQSTIVGIAGCPRGSGSGEVNYAEFAMRATGAKFVVANLHANSNWGPRCDAERLALVASAANNAFVRGFRGPRFIVGDMNSADIPLLGRSNNVSAYLTGAGFADALVNAKTVTPSGIASFGKSGNNLASIDRVFYKGIAAPASWLTVDCAPQASCGSDHHPVAAAFSAAAFRPQSQRS